MAGTSNRGGLTAGDLHALSRRHALSVLAALCSREGRDGLRFSQIAAGVVRNPGQTSSLLRALEQQQLVARLGSARDVRYLCTPKARVALDGLRPLLTPEVLRRGVQFIAQAREEPVQALNDRRAARRSGPLNQARGPDARASLTPSE